MVCPSSLISLIPTLILSVVLAYAAPLPSSSSSVLLLSERAAPVAPVAPAIVAPVAPVAPVIIAPVAPVAPVINQVKNNNKPSSFTGQYYNPYYLRQGHVWHPRRQVEDVEEERNQIILDSSTPPQLPRQLLGRRYHLQPTQDQGLLPAPELLEDAPCRGHEDEEKETIVVVAPQDLESSDVAFFELDFEATFTQALEWSESKLEELSALASTPQEETWRGQCEGEGTCEGWMEGELGLAEDAYDLILQYEEVEEEEEELDLEKGWLGSEEGILVQ